MAEKFPVTPAEYDLYIETHGHTPTQDPIYNHAVGSPTRRLSIEQENLSFVDPKSAAIAEIIEKGTMTQVEIDAKRQF